MSERCQTRKSPSLFVHLVGAGEKGLLGSSAHRLCGFEIDDEFELGRLPYRKWSGLHRRFKKQDKHARPIHLQLVQLEASRRMSFTHCIGASA